jgi:hypothetical protein
MHKTSNLNTWFLIGFRVVFFFSSFNFRINEINYENIYQLAIQKQANMKKVIIS